MPSLGEEKRKKRKEVIFQAAVELFNRKGFSETTMKEIAERTDFAVGTLYNYFRSKNQLLLEIIASKFEEIQYSTEDHFLRIAHTEDNPKKILSPFFRMLIKEFSFLNKQSWLTMFLAMFSSSHFMDQGFQLNMEMIALLEKILKIIKTRGLIRAELDCKTTAFSLYSVFIFSFMGYIYYEEYSREELMSVLDQQLDILLYGLLDEGIVKESKGESL